MPRYSTTVESAAALAAAPTTFANIVAGASANFKLRRVMIGVRAGATTPTSQQVTVGIARATARGTQTANQAGIAIDPRAAVSVITGVDTTWSTPPTVAAAFIAKPTLNTQSMADVPWEFTEELQCDQGTANGIAFQNVGNALPTAHFFVITLEWEE